MKNNLVKIGQKISKYGPYWGAKGLDLLYPPHSLLTGRPLGSGHLMGGGEEAALWRELVFLDQPCCLSCGFPFEFFAPREGGKSSSNIDPNTNPNTSQNTSAIHCGACIANSPPYDGGRAALAYDDISRKMILDFKHGGRTDGLDFFGHQLKRAGRDFLAHTDIIIPVPLHTSRLRKRRFNQAALLARKLSKMTEIPYDTNALLRVKKTSSQGAQSYRGRRKNVRNAFVVPDRFKAVIMGKSCLVIDDVWTSGATLSECAKCLKRAGAKQVYVLTLMRVVRPLNIPKYE